MERAARAITPFSLDGGPDTEIPAYAESLPARKDDPLETLAGRESRERVRDWLATLAESPHNKDRRAAELLRRYFELAPAGAVQPDTDDADDPRKTAEPKHGPTYKDLGKETGISRQMVQMLIKHGKERLREIALGRGEQPDDEAAA